MSDVDCGTVQVTDLILNWPQASSALPLDVILSQGLAEGSLLCVKQPRSEPGDVAELHTAVRCCSSSSECFSGSHSDGVTSVNFCRIKP